MSEKASLSPATRTCPKCGLTGLVDVVFGTRRMKSERADGTVEFVERPQSWCKECRNSRPAATTARSGLAKKMVDILGDRLELEDPVAGWPLRCRLRHAGSSLSAAIYLGSIGPSGRKGRENERRIQNPGKNRPVENHPDRVSLLVGIDLTEDQSPVLVLWDAAARFGRLTRYSAFIHADQLESARTDGLSIQTSTNGERILAFTPDNLDKALVQHLEAPTTEPDDELDLEGLSSILAALSEGDVPSSFPSNPSVFESDEINWKSNEWLTFVAEVQRWLVLEQDIDAGRGPLSAADDLFAGMGFIDPDECFDETAGVVTLTELGFARFYERASTALGRKEGFAHDLSEDFGVEQATRRWQARWEDEPESGQASAAEVRAEVDTWKVKDFKDLAEAGGLELNPSYQRDFVWSNSDSQKLLDSVLRGIPLPSIILNKRRESDVYEIVDGKQRLTSILRFIGKHPDGVRYAKEKSTEEATMELYETNYRLWRRRLGINSSEERRHCLPFRLSTYKDDPLEGVSGRYYCEIASANISIQGKPQMVKTIFEQPSKVYLIPVIVYEDTDLYQIQKVFSLYNKQGKHLNAEELRNATYHHLDITKLLLVLGGDSDRPDELVPFVTGVDLGAVQATLKDLQVGDARFHRMKLASWVAALLTHQPKRSDKGIKTPSTSGYINSLLEAVSKDSVHPMRDKKNLTSLAKAMTEGATILQELAGEQDAFSPKFVNKKGDRGRWEDLPTVAAWTASTLAAIAGKGLDDAEELGDAVRAASEARKPLEKQQSRSQWRYLAGTIFSLLKALDVDQAELGGALKREIGFSCIPMLTEIDSLNRNQA